MDYLREVLEGIKALLHDYASFAGMTVMAMYGGLVSYVRSQKTKGLAMRCSEMILEALASAFIGLTIGMLVLSFVDNEMLAVAASGYAGHEGTRKIFRLLNPKIKGMMK